LGTPPPFDLAKTVFYTVYNGSLLFTELKEDLLAYYEFDGTEIRHVFDIKQNTTNKMVEGLVYKLHDGEYGMRGWYWHGSKDVAHFMRLNETGELIGRDSCDDSVAFMLGMTVSQGNLCAICMDDKLSEEGYWNIRFLTDELKKETSTIVVKGKWAEKFVYHKEKIYTLTKEALKVYGTNGELLHKVPLSLNLTNEYFNLPFIDRSGNIWMGNNGYITRISLQKKHFQISLYDEGTPRRVRGIVEDENKKLYVGGVGYLFEFENDHKKYKNYKKPSNIGNQLGMMVDGDYLWAGTEYKGLLCYNKKEQDVKLFPKFREVAG
jgi:hypothetical protein